MCIRDSVWHSLVGSERRDKGGSSFYNAYECVQVLDYCVKIHSEKNVPQEEIGVITPYKRQMLKIKKLQQGKKKVDKEQKVALMKKHLTAIGRHIAKSAKARGHDAAKEIQLWNYAARKSGLKSGEAMKAIFERLSGTEN